jgi:hypothetical protein
VQHIEYRRATIREREARFRSLREAERTALASAPSIRIQLGGSLIRLGRRIAGGSHGTDGPEMGRTLKEALP